MILTAKELAKYLRFCIPTINKLAKEGSIPGVRIGNSWRFDKGVIDAWLGKGGDK